MRIDLSGMLTRNWSLKLAAVVLATLLWTVIKAEEPTRVEIPNIPIEVSVRDPGWALAAPPAPSTATIVFSGPVRELVRLAVERPRIIVPVDEVRDSVELRPLERAWVQLDAELTRTRIEEVRPGAVLLFFERLTTRLVPVAVRVRGTLPPGVELAGPIRVDPPAVRVSGPAHRLQELDTVYLAPLDLGEVREPAAFRVALDTTGLGGLIFSPRRVDVFVPVAPVAEDTLPRDTPQRFGRPPAEVQRP